MLVSQFGWWTPDQGSLLSQVIPVVALALGLEVRESARHLRSFGSRLSHDVKRIDDIAAIVTQLDDSATDRSVHSAEAATDARRALLSSHADTHAEYAENRTAEVWREHLQVQAGILQGHRIPDVEFYIGWIGACFLLVLNILEVTALRSALKISDLIHVGPLYRTLSYGLGIGVSVAFLMPAYMYVRAVLAIPQLGGSERRFTRGERIVTGIFVLVCFGVGTTLL